jgi:folate-binding protein YgfZ
MVARVTTRVVRLDALAHQDRRLLRFTGADLRRFLQGLLSADVNAVRPGHAHPAALLTVKGKLVSEAIVLCGVDESIALAVPAEISEQVLALIDRHIIMDDVQVSLDAAQRFALAWPEGPGECDGVQRFATRHPAPGCLLVGEEAALQAAIAALPRADENEWNLHRIAAAAPGWGHEITADSFPPEVGFVAAVSYDKGCYMGQEPLARIHARGQVNRVMVQVQAATLPSAPVPLAAPDRPAAGRWTTWASSPAGAVGLAIVHRSVAKPGTMLTAEGVGAVEVCSGPQGDDPGVPGKQRVATVQLGKR